MSNCCLLPWTQDGTPERSLFGLFWFIIQILTCNKKHITKCILYSYISQVKNVKVLTFCQGNVLALLFSRVCRSQWIVLLFGMWTWSCVFPAAVRDAFSTWRFVACCLSFSCLHILPAETRSILGNLRLFSDAFGPRGLSLWHQSVSLVLTQDITADTTFSTLSDKCRHRFLQHRSLQMQFLNRL